MSENLLRGSGITFYAAPSTNSYRVAITLEELGCVNSYFSSFEWCVNAQICHRLSYKVRRVNKQAREDKSDWFLTINPSGSLPALTDDHSGEEVTLTESGSILLYLTDKYDPKLKLNYPYGTTEYYEVLTRIPG
jgi:glutathione S-transferase